MKFIVAILKYKEKYLILFHIIQNNNLINNKYY